MLKKEVLMTIEQELERHGEDFLHLRSMVIDQQVSNYPILVFQKPSQTILGKKILDASNTTGRWNVFMTHLEELYLKKIISEDKLQDFQFQYKNNNDKFCILVIHEDQEYSFVFSPIPI